MEITMPSHEKYIFVCVNERPPNTKPSCGVNGGLTIAETLKEAVQKAGLSAKIRVSRTHCLGLCGHGPNVLLFPDNIWFKKVDVLDIPVILEKLGIKP
jgi:(2Fe-2S) ferredoxin